jgi:hypothetical protein
VLPASVTAVFPRTTASASVTAVIGMRDADSAPMSHFVPSVEAAIAGGT